MSYGYYDTEKAKRLANPDLYLNAEEREAYEQIKARKQASLDADARAEARQFVKDQAEQQHFRPFIGEMAKHMGNAQKSKEVKERYRQMGLNVDNIDIERAVRDYISEGG